MSLRAPMHEHADAEQSAWTDALRALAGRDYSRAGLRRRLARRGHAEEAARAAVDRCVEAGYVDDRAYGLQRAATVLARGPRGRRALLHDLRRQGLDPTMIETVVDEALEAAGGERHQLQLALERWRERHGDLDEWSKAKRCFDHLARRGFSTSAVRRALSPWLDDLGGG